MGVLARAMEVLLGANASRDILGHIVNVSTLTMQQFSLQTLSPPGINTQHLTVLVGRRRHCYFKFYFYKNNNLIKIIYESKLYILALI